MEDYSKSSLRSEAGESETRGPAALAETLPNILVVHEEQLARDALLKEAEEDFVSREVRKWWP